MKKVLTLLISILSISVIFAGQSKFEILKNKPGYSSSFANQHEVFIPNSGETKPEPKTLGEILSLHESDSPGNNSDSETRAWADWLGNYGIVGPSNTTGGTVVGDCYYGVSYQDNWLYYVCGVNEGNGGSYEDRYITWAFALDSNYGTHYSVDFNENTEQSPLDISVYNMDSSGNVQYYLFKKQVSAISGQILSREYVFNDPKPYDKIALDETNVMDMQVNLLLSSYGVNV